MKRIKFVVGVLVIMLVCSLGFLSSESKAADRKSYAEECIQGDNIGVGTICFSYDEIVDINPFNVSVYTGGNANVTDDGVRLRKKPSLSATILELMYSGESVLIDYTKSYSIGFNSSWFYVKRIKTGTWGWVNRKFVCEWD